MISYVIKIRTECNVKKLSYYITRFFKKGQFESRYNHIQLKFYTVNNKIIPIGEDYLLNIKNELEIKSYKFYILQNYIHNYLNENDNGEKIEKIVFDYVKSSRLEYLNHIKIIKQNPTS